MDVKKAILLSSCLCIYGCTKWHLGWAIYLFLMKS